MEAFLQILVTCKSNLRSSSKITPKTLSAYYPHWPPPSLGREEKTTRRAEPYFAPPPLGVFSRRKWECERESEWTNLRIWWPEFLSVSFSTLTTAEEPKSLKCIWNKTCIYFHLNISGCKTQIIPRPWLKERVKTIHFVLPHSYFIAFCRDYAYYDMYNSYLCNKTTILARQNDQMGLIMD